MIMRCFVIVLLIHFCPLISSADIPTFFTKIDLEAPLIRMCVTPDGHRMVALVGSTGERPGGLKIIDSPQSQMPVVKGFLPNVSGVLVLAPDGNHALILAQGAPPKFDAATYHQLIAVDLSVPDRPEVRWRRDILARRVILADDASAYAASQPSKTQSDRWQTVVNSLKVGRPEIILEEAKHSQPFMLFSDCASFIVYPHSDNQLMMYDLRPVTPVLKEQKYTFTTRYRCIVSILESGYVVVDDARVPRLGIYAFQEGIPRVATLPHDGMIYCSRLNKNAAGGILVLEDEKQRLHRLDLSNPNNPMFTGLWESVPSINPQAVAGDFLYATDRTDTRHVLVLRLDIAAPVTVDWSKLEAAHNAAMVQYNQGINTKAMSYTHISSVTKRLEETGILLALAAPVKGISRQRAAAILNDYGFLALKYDKRSPFAETALRRAMTLDPKRKLALLNLADALRNKLPALTDFSVRQKQVHEIKTLYQNYLKLGGKSKRHIEAFIQDFPAIKDKDGICNAIVRYANSGRLQEIVADSAININVGGRKFDFVFKHEGTASVPYAYAFDANTDFPLEQDEISIPGEGRLWGGDNLGLVVYRDSAHILQYRDFRHPVATTPLTDSTACHFRAQIVERVGRQSMEPCLCNDISKGKGPPSIDFETPAPITWETIHEYYRETRAIGMRQIAFANDAQPVNIAKFELSSGAGAGCDAEFYDVLDPSGQYLVSGQKHDLLMKLQKADPSHKYPIGCNNKARFFIHRGKVYFEARSAQWPPIDNASQYHRVARIAQGNIIDVCDFVFETLISLESKTGRLER